MPQVYNMGARRPFSGGKITKKLKEYVNPFSKPKQQQIKNEMLDYYRKSQKSHLFIDNRKNKFNKAKDKFSLEDQDYLENDYSLGHFDEPELSEPQPKPKIHLEKKIKKKLLKEVNIEKLNEIDDLFEDVKKDLVFKSNSESYQEELDEPDFREFDAIRSALSVGGIHPEERTKHTHESGLADHSQGQSRRGAGVPPAGDPEERRVFKDKEGVVAHDADKGNAYGYFLNCVNVLYKNLIDESEDIIKKHNLNQYGGESIRLETGRDAELTALLISRDKQIEVLLLTIKSFPLNSNETKLGYLSLQLLERSAEALIATEPVSDVYVKYFLALYRIALQYTLFIPVMFLLAKRIIEENEILAVEKVEETIKTAALIIKHLSIFSKGAYVFSHFWYNKKMEEEVKKFKRGPLLQKVIDELKERGLHPLSMLNSQPKSAMLETPKLKLRLEKKGSKDGLKKAIRKEKKRVSKIIAKESEVIRDEQMHKRDRHRQNVEKRYKEIVSSAMKEQEELKKEATRG